MTESSKYIKDKGRTFNLDEYSLVYREKKQDKGVKFLFGLLVVLAMIALTIAAYISLNQSGTTGDSFLFAAITIASTGILFIVFFLILLNQKDHKYDDGSGLFYLYREEKDYKVVDNFSGSSVAIAGVDTYELKEEVDEYGNPIYYAEEVFDDEGDIFVNEVNSTLIAKEKAITYAEIIASLDESFLNYGLNGDLARALIAAMSFSPMILAKDIAPYISDFFQAINNPSFIIHYTPDSVVSNERTLFTVFEYAKSRADKPIFIYIDGIPSKDFFNYMRPLYSYIDNPNDDYYLSNKGTTSFIPHNVFFLVNIREDNYIYDISRRYLRYISIMKCHISEVEKAERLKPIDMSMKDLTNARRNAMDEFVLSEAAYRKLDNILAILRLANGYVLQNKIQRKIEEYSAILLSLGENEDDVFDYLVTNTIMPAAILTNGTKKLESEFHIIRAIESEFGVDNMKQTKALIKEYISLYAVDGGSKE